MLLNSPAAVNQASAPTPVHEWFADRARRQQLTSREWLLAHDCRPRAPHRMPPPMSLTPAAAPTLRTMLHVAGTRAEGSDVVELRLRLTGFPRGSAPLVAVFVNRDARKQRDRFIYATQSDPAPSHLGGSAESEMRAEFSLPDCPRPPPPGPEDDEYDLETMQPRPKVPLGPPSLLKFTVYSTGVDSLSAISALGSHNILGSAVMDLEALVESKEGQAAQMERTVMISEATLPTGTVTPIVTGPGLNARALRNSGAAAPLTAISSTPSAAASAAASVPASAAASVPASTAVSVPASARGPALVRDSSYTSQTSAALSGGGSGGVSSAGGGGSSGNVVLSHVRTDSDGSQSMYGVAPTALASVLVTPTFQKENLAGSGTKKGGAADAAASAAAAATVAADRARSEVAAAQSRGLKPIGGGGGGGGGTDPGTAPSPASASAAPLPRGGRYDLGASRTDSLAKHQQSQRTCSVEGGCVIA